MLYNDNVYLLTNKFYTIPAYKDYHQAKNAHLIKMDLNYQEKNPQEKWALLMAQFENSLQENDMPNISLEAFRDSLSVFKRKREGTSASLFNLSLTQCVNYFEEFHFLYTTNDLRYKLKSTEKKALLQSISEAMGTCETGINGRFYTALQDHRKDSDWIQDEMSKIRCEVLHLLHNNYGSEDVHTYNKLVALANKENLGIVTKEEILDAHEGLVDTRAVKAFFMQEYPILFEKYEKQTIDNLTNHYLSELISTLELSSVDWINSPLTFPANKAIILQQSIDGHFNGANLTDIVDSLGEMSEDYSQFTLKTKKDIEPIIKRLVTEKLCADQYYVSLEELKDNRATHPDLRIRKGVSLESLINVYESLQQNDDQQIRDALSQNSQVLLSYPELILSQIKSNPTLLLKIPRWLKADTRFIDGAMVILDETLCKAIVEEDNERIDSVTAKILHLIESECGYLQTLSPPILKNARVAMRLLESNALFFGYMDDSLQSNQELLAQAKQANPFSDVSVHYTNKKWLDIVMTAHPDMHWDLPSQYDQEPSLALPAQPLTYHQALANFLRIKTFLTLLSPQQLTASDVLKVIDKINPDLVLKAIEYRKIHSFTPLPFFDNNRAVNDLKQFNQDIKTRLNLDWSQDYLAIRRRACEQENFASIRNPFCKKNAVTYLSKTKDWFTGFKQYQAYQTSKEKLWAELMAIASACYELVISLFKICLLSLALVYVLPILSKIIAPYFWYGFLCSIILSTLNDWFIGNRLLATVSDVIWRIIFLDIEFLFTVGLSLIVTGLRSANQLFKVMSSSYILLTTLLKATLSCFGKNENLAATLEDTCDKALVRLDSIDEISAQEKSDVLRALLLQVKADVNEQNYTFKERLGQKYHIVHHDQEHYVSFLEVASQRRAHRGGFKLNKQPDSMRFFSAATTTEKLMGVLETPVISIK
ncbi:hypothetical protein [Legionella sp.]|uniref:hypothetical protein n=1 Tax=Legionella sp. TaxID=459 RepID=UPI003C994F52